MLTIDPGPTPAGRRREGNSMRWTDWEESVSADDELDVEIRMLTSDIRTAIPGVDTCQLIS